MKRIYNLLGGLPGRGNLNAKPIVGGETYQGKITFELDAVTRREVEALLGTLATYEGSVNRNGKISQESKEVYVRPNAEEVGGGILVFVTSPAYAPQGE